MGCITFSPLAQGVLTDRYLNGIPEGSRASRNDSLAPETLTEEALAKVKALNAIAAERGQSLAQMALAWTLRDPRITSTLLGASSVAQLEQNLGALDNLAFSRRGARGDRRAGARERRQPLGGVERPLRRSLRRRRWSTAASARATSTSPRSRSAPG